MPTARELVDNAIFYCGSGDERNGLKDHKEFLSIFKSNCEYLLEEYGAK